MHLLFLVHRLIGFFKTSLKDRVRVFITRSVRILDVSAAADGNIELLAIQRYFLFYDRPYSRDELCGLFFRIVFGKDRELVSTRSRAYLIAVHGSGKTVSYGLKAIVTFIMAEIVIYIFKVIHIDRYDRKA